MAGMVGVTVIDNIHNVDDRSLIISVGATLNHLCYQMNSSPKIYAGQKYIPDICTARRVEPFGVLCLGISKLQI